MYDSYRQKDFLWGALVGSTVATLAALLFTTKKGKQIQRQIGDMYEEIEDTVAGALSNSKEKLEETAEDAAKKIAPKPKHENSHKDSK